ncbi:MAG: N-acetylmuramic acid 6-phosphate etherase [Geodermatophilaceae bacterium]|nr:N-acetylmuramic acid 6-phosphate etherase [Geodermatophilaceae bacterium]
MDLSDLVTEQRRPDLHDLDRRGTADLVAVMADDQLTVAQAAAAQAGPIAAAVEAIVDVLREGGRLVYVGAGTAGRLGLLDAVECPPTFDTDRIVGVLAGGDGASMISAEAVEDDAGRGAHDIGALDVSATDAVVGIAASGRTPYTLGAVDEAHRRGAVTVGVSCNADTELSRRVDHPIEIVVGPEFIAGSTRLKAGSAQKLVLNTLSTLAMVRLGKTYGDLMVDVRATNAKLRDRALRIVVAATAAEPAAAERALATAAGSVKTAIVMLLAEVSVAEATRRLAEQHGFVRAAVGDRP